MKKFSLGWLSYITACFAFAWWCYWMIYRPQRIIIQCHNASQLDMRLTRQEWEREFEAKQLGSLSEKAADHLIEYGQRKFDECLHARGIK